jgi:hypothetical protein
MPIGKCQSPLGRVCRKLTTPSYRIPQGVTLPRYLRPTAAVVVDFIQGNRKILSKIDNARFSQPTRHHWRGASRDILLLALSILKTGKRNSLF